MLWELGSYNKPSKTTTCNDKVVQRSQLRGVYDVGKSMIESEDKNKNNSDKHSLVSTNGGWCNIEAKNLTL